jgi:SAM-dependent methyltransferase
MTIAIDYAPVLDIFQSMQTEKIGETPLSDVVGGGDPFVIARDLVGLIAAQADLRPTDHVLDIGCGCGRLATALSQHLGATGSYIGVDIIPKLIAFARARIGSRFPNFRFFCLDRANSKYESFRAAEVATDPGVAPSIPAVVQEASIDLCIATSLFTHLDAATADEYLGYIARALKPDGRAFLTFFLLDDATRAMMAHGRPVFRFPHASAHAGVTLENPDSPGDVAAFESGLLATLLEKHGLYIDRLLNGSWADRGGAAAFQDVTILRPRRAVVGHLDVVTPGEVSGWSAKRNGAPDTITLTVCVDGAPAGTVRADLFREDLIPYGYGTGHHGFRWIPPRPLKPGAIVSLRDPAGVSVAASRAVAPA